MSIPFKIPAKESNFHVDINIYINYLNLPINKSRLVTSVAADAALTLATSLVKTYNELYQQSKNPNLATATITANRNATRDQIEIQLRIIFADIPLSVITQIDRDSLNISIRATTRTPSPVPSITPHIEVLLQEHLSLTLYFNDTSNPLSTAMSAGVKNIDIEFAYQSNGDAASDLFPADKDFKQLGLSSRTKFTYRYSQDMVRKDIFIRARYLNSRNKAGNWSQIVKLILV